VLRNFIGTVTIGRYRKITLKPDRQTILQFGQNKPHLRGRGTTLQTCNTKVSDSNLVWTTEHPDRHLPLSLSLHHNTATKLSNTPRPFYSSSLTTQHVFNLPLLLTICTSYAGSMQYSIQNYPASLALPSENYLKLIFYSHGSYMLAKFHVIHHKL
jgi:hypothetical protein